MVTLTLEGISEGTARAGAGNAAILLNASPFFVLILGRIFLRQSGPRSSGSSAWSSASPGSSSWSRPSSAGSRIRGDFALGMTLALLGALGWAVGVLMTKSIFTRHPDLDMLGFTTAQYVVGGAAAVVLAFTLRGVGQHRVELRRPLGGDRVDRDRQLGDRDAHLLRRAEAYVRDDRDGLAVPRAGCRGPHGDRLRQHTGRRSSSPAWALAIVGVAVVNIAPRRSRRWPGGGETEFR